MPNFLEGLIGLADAYNATMSESDFIDTVVVGAGVVGLAVARQLALDGHQVMVLEKHKRFGEGVSSRNSEVIHAGIYYPQGSLKAELCVQGKQKLYEYCSERNVSHRNIGKIIVATSTEEEPELDKIRQKASSNGVDDLYYLTGHQLGELEPNISATQALMSPSTGIIDIHSLMTSLLADLEAHDGILACHADVRSIHQTGSGFEIETSIQGESYKLSCHSLVNAGGLGAQSIARAIDSLDRRHVPDLHLCRGNYFLLQGKNPFNHLIYPVPDPTGAGLGVHATIDIGGQVKFGPDVEYITTEDYRIPASRLSQNYAAIRRYYPALEDGVLVPGYAGIRPKLQGPGDPVADFVIQSEADHGVPNLVNLFGIESPGLTSSMAIAETVSQALAEGVSL